MNVLETPDTSILRVWNVGYTNYENSSDAQTHMLFCQDFSLITVSSHFVRMTLKKSKLDARTKRNFPASAIWNDVGLYSVLLDICKYKLFGLLSKLLASLMRNYFPKRPSGAPLHTLSKLYDVPDGFVLPPPYIEDMYCFICGRRRVAVAQYQMICLVLLYFAWTDPKKGETVFFSV